MAYNPQNPNGQTTAANSSPVVLASDQTAIPPYFLQTTPANLATAASSTSVFNTVGTESVTVGINTTTTGTFIIEGTNDPTLTNWFSVEVFDLSSDLWVSGTNITPTSGRSYAVLSCGKIAIRLRTVTTLGATVAHTFYAAMGNNLIAGIDTGAAPHNFGYTIFHKDAEYTTAQTTTQFYTPTSGKRFAITDLSISVSGTAACLVTVYDAAASTAYTANSASTLAIYRGNFVPSATVSPGVVKTFNVPYVSAAANNRIQVTTSSAQTVYIQVNGYEI